MKQKQVVPGLVGEDAVGRAGEAFSDGSTTTAAAVADEPDCAAGAENAGVADS